MCQSVVIVTAALFLIHSKAELNSEEEQAYTSNNYFAPSTFNFQDIYSSIAVPSEETLVSTTVQTDNADASTTLATENLAHPTPGKDEFHLENIGTRFVEFRPKTEPVTTPAPIFILNSSYLKKNDTNETSTSTSTTTEDPEEINVLPIKKNYQRGVLDLLFPAVRVKSFKSVFNMFRRLLSHTF